MSLMVGPSIDAWLAQFGRGPVSMPLKRKYDAGGIVCVDYAIGMSEEVHTSVTRFGCDLQIGVIANRGNLKTLGATIILDMLWGLTVASFWVATRLSDAFGWWNGRVFNPVNEEYRRRMDRKAGEDIGQHVIDGMERENVPRSHETPSSVVK